MSPLLFCIVLCLYRCHSVRFDYCVLVVVVLFLCLNVQPYVKTYIYIYTYKRNRRGEHHGRVQEAGAEADEKHPAAGRRHTGSRQWFWDLRPSA